MIILSHYSYRLSKLVGKNSVQVLATLFLIPYTTLVGLIIDVFPPASLDGNITNVWHLDGNIEYFDIKHAPLLIATTFFLALTISYTIVLLTVQIPLSHHVLGSKVKAFLRCPHRTIQSQPSLLDWPSVFHSHHFADDVRTY